jgi:hypothetical protein
MEIRAPSITTKARPAFLGRAQRRAQLRGLGGQQPHGLGDVPPSRSGADAEPGRQYGERLALAQVSQDQQGLPTGIQLPPARPDPRMVAADQAGDIGQGLARQRQRSIVNSVKVSGQTSTIVVITSSTRGFALPPADAPHMTRLYRAMPRTRMKRLRDSRAWGVFLWPLSIAGACAP